MARYRHKSDDDLAWNAIRRTITSAVNVEVANAREVVLNKALSDAWDKYTDALGHGTVPEIEAKYSRFARAVVQDLIQVAEVTESDDASTTPLG